MKICLGPTDKRLHQMELTFRLLLIVLTVGDVLNLDIICLVFLMQQRSHVPKFGNWESGESVPYTAYFDKARKTRGGKIINPNDPEENPDMNSDQDAPVTVPPPAPRSEPEKPQAQAAPRTRRSEEFNEPRQFKNSPARQEDAGRRGPVESVPQRQGRGPTSGEANRRPPRQSAGSENSFDKSPLHNQARISGRGSGDQSPSWEGKGLYKNSQGTPGRSRLRPTGRGDESVNFLSSPLHH